MSQRLILISGFGGTGKSTTAGALYELLDDCAMFQADHLFVIKPFEIGEKLGRIKLRNCLDVMRNFVEEGYKNVICDGLVWSQAELDAIVKQFSPDSYSLFLFWLTAPKDVRFDRVIRRAEPGDTRDFLELVESTINDPWPLHGNNLHIEKIDTQTASAASVALLMQQRLQTQS